MLDTRPLDLTAWQRRSVLILGGALFFAGAALKEAAIERGWNPVPDGGAGDLMVAVILLLLALRIEHLEWQKRRRIDGDQ